MGLSMGDSLGIVGKGFSSNSGGVVLGSNFGLHTGSIFGGKGWRRLGEKKEEENDGSDSE